MHTHHWRTAKLLLLVLESSNSSPIPGIRIAMTGPWAELSSNSCCCHCSCCSWRLNDVSWTHISSGSLSRSGMGTHHPSGIDIALSSPTFNELVSSCIANSSNVRAPSVTRHSRRKSHDTSRVYMSPKYPSMGFNRESCRNRSRSKSWYYAALSGHCAPTLVRSKGIYMYI